MLQVIPTALRENRGGFEKNIHTKRKKELPKRLKSLPKSPLPLPKSRLTLPKGDILLPLYEDVPYELEELVTFCDKLVEVVANCDHPEEVIAKLREPTQSRSTHPSFQVILQIIVYFLQLNHFFLPKFL